MDSMIPKWPPMWVEYSIHVAALDAERAARAREEARALAAEAELARVRAEAETVRVFYEQRHLAMQQKLDDYRARLGGEMLRVEHSENALMLEQLISGGRGALLQSYYLKVEELFTEITRLKKEKAAILDVKSTDGLSSSEWLMRTALAQRERDEARAEIERLRAVVAQLQAVPLSEEGDADA